MEAIIEVKDDQPMTASMVIEVGSDLNLPLSFTYRKGIAYQKIKITENHYNQWKNSPYQDIFCVSDFNNLKEGELDKLEETVFRFPPALELSNHQRRLLIFHVFENLNDISNEDLIQAISLTHTRGMKKRRLPLKVSKRYNDKFTYEDIVKAIKEEATKRMIE